MWDYYEDGYLTSRAYFAFDTDDRLPDYLREYLNTAIRNGDEKTVLSVFKQAFCLQEIETENPSSLHLAVKEGNEDIVKMLLVGGAYVNDGSGKRGCGETPLMWAAKYKKPEIAKLLLYYGGRLDNEDKECGKTPLHFAAESGCAATVEVLILWGVARHMKIVDATDKDEKTPLHLAVEKQNADAVELLIKYADPNIVDRYGCTPLHYAAKTGNLEIVRMLSRRWPRQDIRDNRGYRPIDYAVSCKHAEVENLLSFSNMVYQQLAHDAGRTRD